MSSVIPFDPKTPLKLPNEGAAEAHRLAFACYTIGLTQDAFDRLSMQEQVDFARGNGGLDVPALVRALRYLAAYHAACAEALERYRDSHGHA